MISYKRKTIHISYDGEKVNEALEYYDNEFGNSNNQYTDTKETATNMNNLIKEIFNSIERKEIEVDSNRKETEEEAREYFGEEFIEKFETLRKEAKEQGLIIAIHGTDIECAKSIQMEGLHYGQPTILSTACIKDDSKLDYDEYSNLLNWPHREYKGLVLIGIPKECFGTYKEENNSGAKPLWKYTPSDFESQFSPKYTINSEFILGYIDVNNRAIINNPSHTKEHDYSDLVHDVDIAHRVNTDLEMEDNESHLYNQTTIENNTNSNTLESNEMIEEPLELLIDARDELRGKLCTLQRSAEVGILEEDFDYFFEDLTGIYKKIEMAIPNLETNEQINEKDKMRDLEQEQFLTDNSEELYGEDEWLKWDDDSLWDDEIDDAIAEVPIREVLDVAKEIEKSELQNTKSNNYQDADDR